jgi:hypothetical protein
VPRPLVVRLHHPWSASTTTGSHLDQGSRGAAGSTDASWHAVLATPDTLGRLAAFRRPRLVRYLESLPRNALGKVVKHELRG